MLAASTALKNLWSRNMPGAMTNELTGTQWRSWILPKKMELLVKEAIHIQQTPKGLQLNRDNGWQIPESWNATLRTDMMSSREAHHPEQSIDGEAQAMEMDS